MVDSIEDETDEDDDRGDGIEGGDEEGHFVWFRCVRGLI